ncbi:MAG: type III secretion system chaperone [Alteromonadaceae bacterium]|nr:type III secretion system chaperone [Alteromonadaceae bacterium]
MKFNFQQLINDFAVKHDQAMSGSVEDACHFSWDDIAINIYSHEENGTPTLIATVSAGHVSNRALKSLSSEILEANYLWSGTHFSTLSYNSLTEELVICDRMDVIDINVELLSERITELFQSAKHWQGVINHEENKTLTASTPVNDYSVRV